MEKTVTEKELYLCPCCGNKIIGKQGNYEICSVCDWEDDPVQSEDPDFSGGANMLNLNEARLLFFSKIELTFPVSCSRLVYL